MPLEPDWLELREPLDANARDGDLLLQLRRSLRERERVFVVDVGAKTGSLLRDLAPRFARVQHRPLARPQRWLLIEPNAALRKLTPDLLRAWSQERGHQQSPSRELALCSVRPPMTAKVREGTVETLEEVPVPADVVVGNGLFEHLTAGEITRLSYRIQEWGSLLYATLNFAGGMRFTPSNPVDALIVERYRAYLRRDRPEGLAALGHKSLDVLRDRLERIGYAMHTAPSSWEINTDQPEALVRILQYLEVTVPTFMDAHERGAFERWLLHRRIQIKTNTMRFWAEHTDVLAVPEDPDSKTSISTGGWSWD